MSKTRWHSGPPPSHGWWPASVSDNDGVLRWYDDDGWSIAVSSGANAATAARFALVRMRPEHSAFVRWRNRPASWPRWSKT